jgi:3-oxoadipate enol-lactonase
MRGFVDIAEGVLAYELTGKGTPVVLLHGFSLDMRSWDRQIAAFAERHTVLRYDLRGFGRSSTPRGPYSHAADLAALLAALDLAPAHLVGLSLGANVALAAALEHPETVRSLVLVSSGLAGHPWREQRPPEAAMAHAERHGVAAARAFWLAHPLFASTRAHPEAGAALAAIVGDYSGWHWENRNPAAPFTADAASLGAVAAPALIVSGEQDMAGYREIAATLAAGIPGAALLRLPQAGHMLTMEAPDRFNRAALDLLAAIDGKPELPTRKHGGTP